MSEVAATIRRPVPILLPAAVALGVALVAWLSSVGDFTDYFRHATPPGQTLYVFSKLAGLAAGTLLTAQVVLIVLRGTLWFARRFAWPNLTHVVLGLLTVSMLCIHVTLFVAAASLRGDALALDLLLPVFGADPDRTGISFGGLGLVLLAMVVPLGVRLRRANPPRWVRLVHRCGALGLALGIVHAITVGSEKSTVVALAICALLVAGVVVWRRVGSPRGPLPV